MQQLVLADDCHEMPCFAAAALYRQRIPGQRQHGFVLRQGTSIAMNAQWYGPIPLRFGANVWVLANEILVGQSGPAMGNFSWVAANVFVKEISALFEQLGKRFMGQKERVQYSLLLSSLAFD